MYTVVCWSSFTEWPSREGPAFVKPKSRQKKLKRLLLPCAACFLFGIISITNIL